LRQRQATLRTISSFSEKTTAFLSVLVEDSSLLDSLSDMLGVLDGSEKLDGSGGGEEEKGDTRRGLVMIYRPTFTSVVPDNTTCSVVAFADVFVVTSQHSSSFGHGLSFRSLCRALFFSCHTSTQPEVGTVHRRAHVFCLLAALCRMFRTSCRGFTISHSW
jgi:hypothetical protein